jgi:predicted transcriptional regulator with HTH domain
MNVLKEISQQVVVKPSNVLSSLLMGAGLCYSIENQTYSHIPIVILFPSVYAGYNIYKNGVKYRPEAVQLCKDIQRKIKRKPCWYISCD